MSLTASQARCRHCLTNMRMQIVCQCCLDKTLGLRVHAFDLLITTLYLEIFDFDLRDCRYGLNTSWNANVKHKSNLGFVCCCCMASIILDFDFSSFPAHPCHWLRLHICSVIPTMTIILYACISQPIPLSPMAMDRGSLNPPILLPLSTIYITLEELGQSVHVALCMQMGGCSMPWGTKDRLPLTIGSDRSGEWFFH